VISSLGNYLQIFTILFSILAFVTAIFSYKKLAIIFFYLSFLSTLLSFLLLIYSFIVSDFSLQNVFLNSSTLKPLGFKIAASWASHEGSILLWLCLLQTIGVIYVSLFSPSSSEKSYHIICLSLIQIMFSSFIYFTSNPFVGLSFRPAEGMGLNPMLQDIALIIHPPILYLGYVSYVVPFTSACSMLLTSSIIWKDLRVIKIFVNLGMIFSTLGIALGSWWAYRELGWGGFWFFDPVENISLLPWLSGIMLHHSILVTLRSRQMRNWTIPLSIATFLLVIFSTFLVRSGLIISIHSFASSPKRAIYMLAIFVCITMLSLTLLILRSNKIVGFIETKPYRKTPYIIWGNIFFLISLTILLCATIYPLFYSLLYQESVTISEKFFINNFIIFFIPVLLLVAIAQIDYLKYKNLIILIASTIITIYILRKIEHGFTSTCFMIFSIFVIIQNCYLILYKSDYFKTKIEANIAMIIGHLGFGLLTLTITLNSLLQTEVDFVGKIGDKVVTNNFEIVLRDIRVASAQNYYRQIAEFWIQDKQGNVTILMPENRFYIIEKILSQESNIYSYLTYDLYAVLNTIDGEVIHAKIYYNPMISFIWLSIAIIICGFAITAVSKRNNCNFVTKKENNIVNVSNL